MSDCLGTPRRLASLSKRATIQTGKSTFTLFCSCPGRPAFSKSKSFNMFLPVSNFLSNSLAFIKFNLLLIRDLRTEISRMASPRYVKIADQYLSEILPIRRYLDSSVVRAGITRRNGSFQSCYASLKSIPCFDLLSLLLCRSNSKSMDNIYTFFIPLSIRLSFFSFHLSPLSFDLSAIFTMRLYTFFYWVVDLAYWF